MSQMSTQPVFACRVCKRPVKIAYLETREDDPDGSKLRALMKAMADIALCPTCQRKRDYYASQNREAEFLANELNPHVVLYSVEDKSGVGWYASGVKEADRANQS